MAFDFRVYGPQGQLWNSMSTRSGRVLGKVTLTANTGTIVLPVPASELGTVFIFCPKLPRPAVNGNYGEIYMGGNFTVNQANKTLSWGFQATPVAVDVYYGVY